MYENPLELLKPYASILSEFGRKHRFKQEICKHDVPVWDFFFPHPLYGLGHVYVQVNEKSEVFVRKFWPQDELFRFAKPSESQKIENPPETFEEVLENAVNEILSWKSDRSTT